MEFHASVKFHHVKVSKNHGFFETLATEKRTHSLIFKVNFRNSEAYKTAQVIELK